MNSSNPNSNRSNIENSRDDDATPEQRGAGVFSLRVCAVVLVFYALYYARSLTVPVATAFVIYMVLRPLVRQGKRWGIPPAVGATGIIVGLLIVFGLATYWVVEPAQRTIANAPRHVAVVKEKLSFLTNKLREVNEAREDLAETNDESESTESGGEEEEIEPVPVEIKQPNWISNVTYLSGTGNAVTFVTICVALVYFLLATGDNLLRSIMHALPNFTARRQLLEVIENVQEGLGNYLAKITAINACLGLAVGTAMWLLGMPSPILWGVMAFVFNFIPIIGAITGAIVIFVVALVNFEPTYYAFIVSATFITLTSLEGQFITPAVLGRSMSMSPVLVFLSIVVWGWMWGIMGVFLSVPILIAARMACEGYDGLQPIAFILGAEVPQPEVTNEETSKDPLETEAANNDSDPARFSTKRESPLPT